MQATESIETPASPAMLRHRLVLLPPVSLDDLRKDIEYDPAGADEFVALMRSLRQPNARAFTL